METERQIDQESVDRGHFIFAWNGFEHALKDTSGSDRSLHNNVGTRIEMQINTPPIVGVPLFF